jgi:carbamoyl-phosphate synthase large subunit
LGHKKLKERRILLTGAGGIGGTNFIRSLRLAEDQNNERFFVVGTDYNIHYIEFPDTNLKFRTPKHTNTRFISTLIKLIKDNKLEFLHPHPSSEAKVVSENREQFEGFGVMTYLPRHEDIMPDKLYMHQKLNSSGVPVPKAIHIELIEKVDDAFMELNSPLWIRSITGAGGRLSLKVNSSEEAKLWIKLNVIPGRAKQDEFVLQEYLPGRDLAFDSLWFGGKLITSYSRERLEYPFKHISLSGITGTPSVARILRDKKINSVGISAVKALNPKPHGFYSVDMREDVNGNPRVTEVDGKWHTTAPLWGCAFAKAYNKASCNIAYSYLMLGYGENLVEELPITDLFPEEHYLIRQMDSGIILKSKENLWRIA